MSGTFWSRIISELSGACILCVGDIMLDRFSYGTVSRISPESPIPVLLMDRVEQMLGGAGNVARNVSALGGRCTMVGLIGDDPSGEEVVRLLRLDPQLVPCLVCDPARPTTEKARFIAMGQQLLRVDRERTIPVAHEAEDHILEQIASCMSEADVVILSDYAKGILTDRVLKWTIDRARAASKPVIVDPKSANLGRYDGATVITPNAKEVLAATAIEPTTDAWAVKAGLLALDRCQAEAILITRGEQGMTLVRREGSFKHCPSTAREVFDVSGAGDTAVAAFALGVAVGASYEQAMEMANAAAGVAVSRRGTSTVSHADLASALAGFDGTEPEGGKLLSLEEMIQLRHGWRQEGRRVALTNGCFDLLHPGHVRLLTFARNSADRLIVALNSDESVKRLKGDGRPVRTQHARVSMLSALSPVDAIVVFDDDTPLRLIEAIRPDVLVKGADYELEQIVGADIVLGYGGEVLRCAVLPGHSTTKVIEMMQLGITE